MDVGLDLLGREAPELFRMELEQAKQSPHSTITRQDKDGKDRQIAVYDKDIARLAQTSRQFLIKALFDITAASGGTKRTMAEEALKELIQIQVQGDLVIEQTQLAGTSRVLAGQADEGEAVIAGTARDIS